MSKEPGPREKALREMREARFTENAKITTGIRKAAAAGKALLDMAPLPKPLLRKLKKEVDAAAERMKNKPSKKAKKK